LDHKRLNGLGPGLHLDAEVGDGDREAAGNLLQACKSPQLEHPLLGLLAMDRMW
jgi:hypothetical protein